jgi:hypothetical protein
MHRPEERFSEVRMAALLLVLAAETALTVSLWQSGWLGTGSHLRLMLCGIAAGLPLLLALVIIFRHRFRFSLRSLLMVMALVAVFMFASVRPLLEAYEARRASQLLALNGVELQVEPLNDEFYMRLGHDPRPPRSLSTPRGEIPLWLRPLAGDLSSLPPDEAVISLDVSTDEQVLALSQMAPRLKNLESLQIWGRLSPSAMALLQKIIPQLERLAELHVGVPTPAGWLGSLTSIRSLFVRGVGAAPGTPLTIEQFQEIANLPRLEVLSVFGDGANDATVPPLAGCKTLRRLLLRKTDVSPSAARALSDAMPNCEILR